MLGAAHVLAMDSKNLLDVVDAIRIRYPQINMQLHKLQEPPQFSDQQALQIDTECSQAMQSIVFPTPVTCTFMQMYPQNIQTTASTSISTNKAADS